MAERTVSLAELVNEKHIEVGAGRPRSVNQGQDLLPILRVADVLDGKIGSIDLSSSLAGCPREFGPKVSRPGDVVLTVKGTVGRVALMPSKGPRFAYSPQLCYFRPCTNGPLVAKYLYYWFRSAEFWIQANALKGQTDMADFISLGDILSLKLQLPSRAQQANVVAVLGILDDKIAVNERIVDTADSLKSACYLRAQTKTPGEFRHAPLSSSAEFINGRPFTKDATGTGRMVVRIAELNSGPGASTVYNEIEVPAKHLVHPGDILFAWSGSLTVARWFRPQAIVNQHIFKVVPKNGRPSWLVAELVRLKLDSFRAIAADKATTMGHIQRRHLDEPVLTPNDSMTQKLDAQISPLWDRALAAEQESLGLATLRDTLLPQLMSGKLRVRDAEKIVEDAV